MVWKVFANSCRQTTDAIDTSETIWCELLEPVGSI
jgi:hypothetical protein